MTGPTQGRVRALALAVVLAVALPPAAAHAAQSRPNVVVVETDDQTAAELSAMPTVERLLAHRGVTFDNSFVSYSLCCPSRATFLTGQYAHNHGVLDNKPPDGGYYKLDGTHTLPVWLQAAGYRTIHVGKYLNGYGDRDATEVPPGWSDWHGLIGKTAYRYYGFALNDNGHVHAIAPRPANYQTDVLTRKAGKLIRDASGDRRPFFMWAAFVAPHDSADPPEPGDPPHMRVPRPASRDRDTFADEPLPTPPSFDERDVSDKPVTVRGFPLLTAEKQAEIRKEYQRELESLQAVDRGVGRIVAALRRGHELGRTLLVFTSDNGYFHGEHRITHGKSLPYEPSIRVPLVIRGPGVPRGIHLQQLVSNQDLAPTILDVTGVQPGLPQDGLSLRGLVRHPKRRFARDLLVEGRDPSPPHMRFAGIRTRRWFYAEYADSERELYDLAIDPDETTSRAGRPRYAPIESALAGRLAVLRTCRGASCRSRPSLAERR